MLNLKAHSFPIEQSAGYSTHIRLRLHFDKYPLEYDVRSYLNAADKWFYGCGEGRYLGRKIKIISYRPFFRYYSSTLQVDFDIAYAPDGVVDELLREFEAVEPRPGSCRVVRAEIAFFETK